MIRKSVKRFSEKIMLKPKSDGGRARDRTSDLSRGEVTLRCNATMHKTAGQDCPSRFRDERGPGQKSEATNCLSDGEDYC